MHFTFTEPTAPRYVHINPVTNLVHLLIPVVGGQEISTDNTCKSMAASDEFYNGAALHALNAYKSALELDLQLLDDGHPLKAAKLARLTQINVYIEAIPAMKERYSAALSQMMQQPSNLYSMQLRPKVQDPQSRVVNPVFNTNRLIDNASGTPLSALYNAMYAAYPNIKFAVRDPRTQLNHAVQVALSEQPDVATIQRVLTEQCKLLFGLSVNFTQDKEGRLVNQASIDTFLDVTDDIPATTQDYIDTLLNTCALNLWDSIPVSPFYSVKDDADKTEKLSILTQFFLAHVNIYCAVNDISKNNFGAILDASKELSEEIALIVFSALESNTSVEESLCTFFNEHAVEFGLSRALTSSDMGTIQQKFERTYATVTATNENPHMDDFMVLDTTTNTGKFVTHQGSICIDFSDLVVGSALDNDTFQAIRADFEVSHACEVSPSNLHIQASHDLDIETLISNVDDNQFEKLPLKVRLECMKSPAFLLRTFLHDVAKGKQDEAQVLLKNQPEKTQALLTSRGTFTDYSGRIFSCSAYEYAYWAKDKHMCRMLEAEMDPETKAVMLERIDALELNGLTYKQHDQERTGSKGFNLAPLKTAYEDYIRIYTAWEQAHYTDVGEAAVIAAWMNVGQAQRDLPVHYVNEYFRKDRSFDPLPKFDELSLPRELKFYNYNTNKEEVLFPLAFTASSGLGVDFSFIRAWEWGGWEAAGSAVSAVASIDLAAVSHLDVVRTEDLKQSHKNLEPAVPALCMI